MLKLAAVPISLATTLGISVDFFSCSYLDVSVRRVRFTHLCIQWVMTTRAGFPHSEICGSKCVCSLPAAYRKLLRPSSPDIAKASTMCTYSLVPITLASQSFALPRDGHKANKYYVFACIGTRLLFRTTDRQYYLIWYNQNPSAHLNNACASLVCTNKSLLLPNC